MKQSWNLIKLEDGCHVSIAFDSIYYDYAYLSLYITSKYEGEFKNIKLRYSHFNNCKARIGNNNPLFKNLNTIFNDGELSIRYKTLIMNQFISIIDNTSIIFNGGGLYRGSSSIDDSQYPILESSNWSDRITLEYDIELLNEIKRITHDYKTLLDEYNEYARVIGLKEMPLECIEYDVSILYDRLKKASIIG
jgi:hypothetical protein